MRFLVLATAVALAATPLAAQQQGGDGGLSRDARIMQSAEEAMHGALTNGAHLRLTEARKPTRADSVRGDSIVAVLRASLAKYRDVKVAEREGFQIFAPELKNQPVFHFTHYGWAIQAHYGFDPARPPSLLYRKDAKGRFELVGAMYTAPADATPEELDARVPLSMARWHLHVNICTPQPVWDREAWARRKNGQLVFGPASPIATRSECEKEGGRFHPRLFGWMVHVNAFESDPWGQEHAKGGHSH
jgi:hypothetical protein